MIIPWASRPFTSGEEQVLTAEAADVLSGRGKLLVRNNERGHSTVFLTEKEKADQTITNEMGTRLFILDRPLRDRLLSQINPPAQGWRLERYMFRNLEGVNRPIDGRILESAIDMAKAKCSAKREGGKEYLVNVKHVMALVDTAENVELLEGDPKVEYARGFKGKCASSVTRGEIVGFSGTIVSKTRAYVISLQEKTT